MKKRIFPEKMIVIDKLVIGEVEGRNDDDFVFDCWWVGSIVMMKYGRKKVQEKYFVLRDDELHKQQHTKSKKEVIFVR